MFRTGRRGRDRRRSYEYCAAATAASRSDRGCRSSLKSSRDVPHRGREKSQDPQAEGVGDEDNVTAFDHQAAVVDDATKRRGASSGKAAVAATRQPHHQREQRRRRSRRRPDIEPQAIFTARNCPARGGLRTDRSEAVSLENLLPSVGWLWRPKAKLSDGRFRVGDALERSNGTRYGATHRAGFRTNDVGPADITRQPFGFPLCASPHPPRAFRSQRRNDTERLEAAVG